MNFSFASAPTTPFITQVDGRQTGDPGRAAQFLSPTGGLAAPLSASAALSAGGPAPMSCATVPLNDIGSPVALQYFLGLNNSPLVMAGESMAMASPSAAAAGTGLGAAPRVPQLQPPALIVTSSPAAAAAAALALSSTMGGAPSVMHGGGAKARSPVVDDEMSGMFRPAEVFTTPEIHALPDLVAEQRTPELPLFEDADMVAAAMPLSALSPRTRTAQAGLTLLAASATYARDAATLTPDMAMFHTASVGRLSPRMHAPHCPTRQLVVSSAGRLSPRMHAPHCPTQQMVVSSAGASPAVGDSQATLPMGSPFLNAGDANATLMSQPHNSLAQHLSPSLIDRGGPSLMRRMPDGVVVFAGAPTGSMGMLASGTQTPVPGMHTLGAGRLTRNRSLLRQSSGLTSASFHNDLVPAASESFFAPLDEVCSDHIEQCAAPAPLLSPHPPASAPPMQNARHMQHTAVTSGGPPMGTQFSPVMALPAGRIHPGHPRTAPPVQPPHAWPLAPAPPQHQHQSHGQMARSVSPYAQPSQGQGQGQLHTNGARSGEIFAQMPTLAPRQGGDGPRQWSASESVEMEMEMEMEMDEDTHSESHSDTNQEDGKRRRSGRALHKRDQQRRFNCDVCDRSFARQYNLKTHRLTHFPDKEESRPYKCPHCPKAFTRRHDLQRHAILHQRTGKHPCPGCGRAFPRKDSLRSHLKLECSGDFNPADVELSPVP